jgi:hypothetical protein
MASWVMKCRFCEKLYKAYDMMAADQSCCPQCRREAGKNR